MARIIEFSDFAGPFEVSFTIKHSKHGRYLPFCRLPGCGGTARFTLDAARRIVTCDHCGEVVDPFDVLLTFAEEERHCFCQWHRYKAAKAEFEKIQSEWSLTIKEKRRIEKAMQEAGYKKYPEAKEND